MFKKTGSFSLTSKGLKYKLKISFYLMSVIPLLVCVYLTTNYIFPKFGIKGDILASILISVVIAIIGFLVIKEVVDRILSMTTEAKVIAAGGGTSGLESRQGDELGDLSDALRQLTQRIHTNMDELKNFSRKTTEINMQIQERVLLLSSLLQISSLISQGEKLENILKLTTQKSRFLANSQMSYLLFREENQDGFSMKAVDGLSVDYLFKITVSPADELFDKLINENKPLVLDADNALSESLTQSFFEKFKIKSTLALPVSLRGKVFAILGIGNNDEAFVYKKEDIELLDILAKQIAIAVENDILMHRLEKLEIKDTLTGLYNKVFIHNRLQEEIKRAIIFQRPCSFVVLDIDNFKQYNQNFGSLQTEGALKKIAALIKDSVSDVDHVGRTGDDEFSILLPEKNKRKALEIAEDVRKKIQFGFSEEQDPGKRITLSGGISENPLDGVDAESLISYAKELLKLAKSQGRNCVVGFKEPPVCL